MSLVPPLPAGGVVVSCVAVCAADSTSCLEEEEEGQEGVPLTTASGGSLQLHTAGGGDRVTGWHSGAGRDRGRACCTRTKPVRVTACVYIVSEVHKPTKQGDSIQCVPHG